MVAVNNDMGKMTKISYHNTQRHFCDMSSGIRYVSQYTGLQKKNKKKMPTKLLLRDTCYMIVLF